MVQIEHSSRTAWVIRIKSAVASVLLALVLTGCGAFNNLVLPGTFDEVNSAVDELNLDEAGEVVLEYRAGGDVIGSGPTYVAFVEGDDALDVIRAELSNSHYSYFESTETWERGSGADSLTIRIDSIAAGDEIPLADGETTTAEAAGIVIAILGA